MFLFPEKCSFSWTYFPSPRGSPRGILQQSQEIKTKTFFKKIKYDFWEASQNQVSSLCWLAGSQRFPEAPEGPRGSQGFQRVPKAPKGSQRLPEAPRSFTRFPEASRSSQRVPKRGFSSRARTLSKNNFEGKKTQFLGGPPGASWVHP